MFVLAALTQIMNVNITCFHGTCPNTCAVSMSQDVRNVALGSSFALGHHVACKIYKTSVR